MKQVKTNLLTSITLVLLMLISGSAFAQGSKTLNKDAKTLKRVAKKVAVSNSIQVKKQTKKPILNRSMLKKKTSVVKSERREKRNANGFKSKVMNSNLPDDMKKAVIYFKENKTALESNGTRGRFSTKRQKEISQALEQFSK